MRPCQGSGGKCELLGTELGCRDLGLQGQPALLLSRDSQNQLAGGMLCSNVMSRRDGGHRERAVGFLWAQGCTGGHFPAQGHRSTQCPSLGAQPGCVRTGVPRGSLVSACLLGRCSCLGSPHADVAGSPWQVLPPHCWVSWSWPTASRSVCPLSWVTSTPLPRFPKTPLFPSQGSFLHSTCPTLNNPQ